MPDKIEGRVVTERPSEGEEVSVRRYEIERSNGSVTVTASGTFEDDGWELLAVLGGTRTHLTYELLRRRRKGGALDQITPFVFRHSVGGGAKSSTFIDAHGAIGVAPRSTLADKDFAFLGPSAALGDSPSGSEVAGGDGPFPGETPTKGDGPFPSQRASVRQGGSADAEGDCSGWTAWHDHQPIGPPRLHVTGECVFPTPGYTVELRPAVPQGVNPKIYILDRIVKPPEGIVPDVITKVQVRYEEKTTEEYSHVQIRPDNTLIEVNDVH